MMQNTFSPVTISRAKSFGLGMYCFCFVIAFNLTVFYMRYPFEYASFFVEEIDALILLSIAIAAGIVLTLYKSIVLGVVTSTLSIGLLAGIRAVAARQSGGMELLYKELPNLVIFSLITIALGCLGLFLLRPIVRYMCNFKFLIVIIGAFPVLVIATAVGMIAMSNTNPTYSSCINSHRKAGYIPGCLQYLERKGLIDESTCMNEEDTVKQCKCYYSIAKENRPNHCNDLFLTY